MSSTGDATAATAATAAAGGAGHNDPAHWRYKCIYYNEADARAFVPKRGQEKYFPWGATVNMATTEGKVFAAVVAGLCVWGVAAMVRDSRRQ